MDTHSVVTTVMKPTVPVSTVRTDMTITLFRRLCNCVRYSESVT